MRTKPGLGETLPALMRRRYGIAERWTLVAAGLVVLLGIAAFLVLYDPLDGKAQRVHQTAPVFNTLYTPGVVKPVEPERGELQRYVARRGPLRLSVAIRRFALPAYKGDVAGVLPVFTQRRADTLARTLDGFELTGEGKARVNKAPGYQLEFRFGPAGDRTNGLDVLIVPPDEPGVRDGVIISYRERRGGVPSGEGTRRVVKAARSAFRSFKFGADRDN